MTPGTVVPEIVTLGEQAFHDRLVAGWSRCIAITGKPAFGDAIRMSRKGLEKVLAGSTPHACTIFNSRSAHPTALDELLSGYRVRLVAAAEAGAIVTGAGLAMLRAATACIEAETDGIDHRELLAMESELRASAAVHAGLIARIDRIKGTGGA